MTRSASSLNSRTRPSLLFRFSGQIGGKLIEGSSKALLYRFFAVPEGVALLLGRVGGAAAESDRRLFARFGKRHRIQYLQWPGGAKRSPDDVALLIRERADEGNTFRSAYLAENKYPPCELSPWRAHGVVKDATRTNIQRAHHHCESLWPPPLRQAVG